MSPLFFTILFTILFRSARAFHDHHEIYRQSRQTVWDAPMEIDVRSMHRHCKGHCYYYPDSCRDQMDKKECTVIVSIQKFRPDCEHANLTRATDLCDRKEHLFSLTLLYVVNPDFMKNAKRLDYNILKCNVEPFVAIAFSKEKKPDIEQTNLETGAVGDVFYVCAAGQPYVTSWIQTTVAPAADKPSCLGDGNTQKSTQLKETNPYPPMGSSVVWSEIETMYKQFAIGCKIILSDLPADLVVRLPNSSSTYQVPVFDLSTIKVAAGVAFAKNDILEDVIFNPNPKPIQNIATTYNDTAFITAFDSHLNWTGPEIELPTRPPEQLLIKVKTEVAAAEINNVYEKCLDRWMMCFTRTDELTCVLRKGCHMLVAIESTDKDFSTLRFHMVMQTTKREGIVRRVFPKGWGAIGFSNDTTMGKDLVFSCMYFGETYKTSASYNSEQNNIVVADESNWVKGPKQTTIKFFLHMDADTALCVFDVETDDIIVAAFFYSAPGTNPNKPDLWPQLHWHLQDHEFDILLAQGTTMYVDGRLSYHTYRGVSDLKFSQERYWDHVVVDCSNSLLIPEYLLFSSMLLSFS